MAFEVTNKPKNELTVDGVDLDAIMRALEFYNNDEDYQLAESKMQKITNGLYWAINEVTGIL